MTDTGKGIGVVVNELAATTSSIGSRKHVEKLLNHFGKTFISLIESIVMPANSDSENAEDNDEADEFFDNFGIDTASPNAPRVVSDEDFAFEAYFPPAEKSEFRSLFIDVAFDIFRSYEYQLVILVQEERKLSEIAEDIVHRILDNFKESQRGFNPEFIKPKIDQQFLIEKALYFSEPEGIIYNSEWSAVEILENPGIVVKDDGSGNQVGKKVKKPTFYKSHWQKNFIGVKKLIGSKYGFRLNFDFETEDDILKSFEKVPYQSVSPLYLSYKYSLDPIRMIKYKKDLLKELNDLDESEGGTEEISLKDKVKEFQQKLQVQKLEEEKNSDKVLKQIANLSRKFETLQDKLTNLEQKGVISGGDEIKKAAAALLRSNYHVRFEVRDEADANKNDTSYNKM